MADFLIAASTQAEMEQTPGSVVAEVQNARLEISTSKIQGIPPWKYLGWKMTEQTITSQKIQHTTVSTPCNICNSFWEKLTGSDLSWELPTTNLPHFLTYYEETATPNVREV